MKERRIAAGCVLCFLLAVGHGAHAVEVEGFLGEWQLVRDMSEEIGLYNTLNITFSGNRDNLRLEQKWGTRRSLTDMLNLRVDGSINMVPVTNRVFPTNVFMGVSKSVGENRRIRAEWGTEGNTLRLTETYPVLVSQGERIIKTLHTYTLSDNGGRLTYTIERDTRKEGGAVRFVLQKQGYRQAHVMRLKDDWSMDGMLPTQSFLISLQGIANRSAPRLYFLYPESWDFTYTGAVQKFYNDSKEYLFTELRTPKQALQIFKNEVKGYIVWDREVRTSLIVAFTAAGLEDAVVVDESLIPLAEEAGLPRLEDFRGRFRGLSDAAIYRWAVDRYWSRCSRDFIIWLGGEHGRIMKPGVADWGIYQRAFFSDLSTRKTDEEEYALADRLLEEMNPMAMVMGWHSYAKDLEREHVSLVSRHGHRVEGLHTLPNLSFSHQVPAEKGFVYRNHHSVQKGADYPVEKKVYLSCVQTDGLGIGAWLEPGRGEIPYAWEVIMNYSWLAPAMMEYFYLTATPNDYFIGALSGPGYIYPKAVPPDKLTPLIEEAGRMMELLDLRVFEIMDYSEGATVEGNTELPKRVVDAYMKGLPQAIGFVNGYAPAFTFAVREKRPLISYDYYLSPTRTEEAAAADLHELAALNSDRPYFCLIHVREYSNVQRVKRILDRLGPGYELLPLDVFLTMAGNAPTYRERFKK